MRWGRYIAGTLLAYLIIASFTIMITGFILLEPWGTMEKAGILLPAQGGNNSIIITYSTLLLATFLITFIYIRLKKAEEPYIFGPAVGLIYSLTTISNSFFYVVPTLKVPIYITLQNVLGFSFAIWIFRKTYYRK